MSEKTTIPERPPGLPFGNNCDDVNAQIVRSAHDAQWQRFIATGNNLVGSPLPLIHSGAVALKGESAMVMNATVIKAEGATIIRAERLATVSPVLGQPDLAVHSKDAQAPNQLLEFLLLLFAGSKRDLAAVGDINELFDIECAKFGRPRANRRYWAQALRILAPLLARAISRATKLAVIIAALKRYFG